MKLYEIDVALMTLFDQADEGEIPEDLEEQLGDLAIERAQKFQNICGLIFNLQAESDMCDAQRARFTARKKSADTKVKWLKDYMKRSMESMDEKKMIAGPHTLGVRANGGKVPIHLAGDIAEVPLAFRRAKEWILERDRIDEYHKHQKCLPPGLILGERGTHLSIR